MVGRPPCFENEGLQLKRTNSSLAAAGCAIPVWKLKRLSDHRDLSRFMV